MQCKTVRQLVSTLALLILISDISSLHAAPRDVSVTLTKNKTFSIKPAGCSLSVSRNTPARIVVKCSGATTRSSGPTSATLSKGRKATLSARSCFLGITRNIPGRFVVKCFATPPTATPSTTPSATPTSSATSTFTASPTSTPTSTPTLTPNAQALAANNVIISFNTSDPEKSASLKTVSGINSGQTLVSIDRRPQNGGLYGFGHNSTTGESQTYFISLAATPIASSIGSSVQFQNGSGASIRIGVDENTKFGIDFDPVAGRMRVVNSEGQNFRIDVNSGAPVDGDLGGASGSGTGVNMDGSINGSTSSIGEVAFTNNAIGSTVSTLYSIDPASDSLYIQTPKNSGTQTSGLGLSLGGTPLNIIEVRGFDIPLGVNVSTLDTAVSSGSASAILEFAANSQQRFCSVNLTNGTVSGDVPIGDGTSNILGLAVQSAPTVPQAIALTTSDTLLRFSTNTPGTTTSFSITGLDTDEDMVGIDFRPATGQLFGLGIDAVANTGTLYRIDPITGAATTIGVNSQISISDFPDPATVGYGFDFIPTADRIRVTTSTGLNLRINPNTGALAAVDSAINGDATGVNTIAYTNPSAGTTITTLYALDHLNDRLVIQNPPNSGTVTTVGTVNLNFSAISAFNIPSLVKANSSGTGVTVGDGFAALNDAGTIKLYKIDLTTGTVTSQGAIGAGSTPVRGLALTEVLAQ